MGDMAGGGVESYYGFLSLRDLITLDGSREELIEKTEAIGILSTERPIRECGGKWTTTPRLHFIVDCF